MLNKNQWLRDEILGIKPEHYMGGIARYSDVSLDVLEKLVELGFVNLLQTHNDSPTISQILDFMYDHSGFKAHGYVVDIKRPDYRVSIEGIKKVGKITKQDIIDFIDLFKDTDDLIVNKDLLYCRYD